MTVLSTIFGLNGPRLTSGEHAFFRDANPWGFILFSRNIETPNQVRRLTQELRECVGRDCLIFVDQEGGRVQRFRPPYWRHYLSYAELVSQYKRNPAATRRLVWTHHRLIAADLRDVGVTANCAPVLDIRQPDADPIISDRAFGYKPDIVIDLGDAALSGLMSGGVAPVVKHIPGHGRANVDSHKSLPRIPTSFDQLKRTDFIPFNVLGQAPMAMTAHAVYQCVDKRTPLTLSTKSIQTLIRDTIAYDGVVMSDDLDMNALSGTLAERTKKALEAGCDIVLQCSGILPSMVDVAKEAKTLSGQSEMRCAIASLCADEPAPFDRDTAMRVYDEYFEKIRAVA